MTGNTVCGVSLATWGTDVGAGNGMLHYADAKLFGGNVGHASLTLTFPSNEETKQWIKEFCLDPPIPYEKHKVVTKKAVLNSEGKYEQSDEVAFEEEVYVVHFSWFPKEGAYTLNTCLNDDGLDERTGVSVNWDPRYRDFIRPEQRYHRGLLGDAQLKTYGARSFVHERNLTIEQRRYINIHFESVAIGRDIRSLTLLQDKIQERINNNLKLDSREQALATKENNLALIKENGDTIKQLALMIKNNDIKLNDLSDTQRTYLKGNLGDDWEKLNKELTEQDKKKVLAKLNDLIKIEKKAYTELKEDSLEKINKERQNNYTISPTEMLLLDRFIPDWKDKVQQQENHLLSRNDFNMLVKLIDEKIAENVKKDSEIEQELKDSTIHIQEGVAKELSAVNLKITEKENNKAQIMSEIEANPLSEDLHRKLLNINSELSSLIKKRDELLNFDVNKYDEIQRVQLNDWNKIVEKLDKLLASNPQSFNKSTDLCDLPIELQHDLDTAFNHRVPRGLSKRMIEFHLKKDGWRNNHVKGKNNGYNIISYEEAIKLRDFAKKQAQEAQEKALDIQPALTALNQHDFERFVTLGLPPDDTVQMQIGQDGGFDKGLEQGLNVKAMLEEIHRITTEGKQFDLETNNCSVTVGRILEAGAQGPHLRSKFQDKALGAIGNPQMVLNNALKYNASVQSPKDNIVKKLSRFNPVEKAGGACIHTLKLDKKASRLKKAAAACALVPIGIVAGIVEGAKKLFNPIKTIQGLNSFVKFVNSKPSLPFKVAATAITLPAYAVLAVPAAAQYTTVKIASGLSKIGSAFTRAFSSSKEKTENKDDSPLEAKLKQKLADKTVYIKANNVQAALDLFEKKLKEHDGPVVLDKKTENKIQNEIRSLKDGEEKARLTSKLTKFSIESMKRVQAIQKEFVANELKTKQSSIQDTKMEKEEGKPDESQRKLVKTKDEVYQEREQIYSVMPILGNELGKQSPSYVFYERKIDKQTKEQKQLGLPATVDPQRIIANDGYLTSKEERDYIITILKLDPKKKDAEKPKEIPPGTTYPEGHPLAGQTLKCSAFRDDNNNIYIVNNQNLGKGNFGTVKVIQSIYAPNPEKGVKEKEFYAVKIQDVTEDNELKDIESEMKMNERVGLHLGGMRVKHKVIIKPPVYEFASQDVSPPVEKESKSVDNKDEDKDKDKEEIDGFDTEEDSKENDEEAYGTMNVKDVQETTDVKQYQAAVEKSDAPADPDAQIDIFKEYSEEKEDKEKSAYHALTLEELAAQQKPIEYVTPARNLSSLDTLSFLEKFEMMAQELERVHHLGILHRDLKAENFLYDPEKKEMRLIDFGTAVLQSDPTLKKPSGSIVGSPINLPPEMFHFDYEDKSSTKQDIYGLARTYELLIYHELIKFFPDAYRSDYPSPNVNNPVFYEDASVEQFLSLYLNNFRFKGDESNPHIKAINKLLSLMNEMKDLQVNNRPEASQIKQQLQAIIKEYKLAMNREDAKENIPDASIQRHLDYLNNFITLYDSMAKQVYEGANRQQRMREELKKYEDHANPKVSDLARLISKQLYQSRTTDKNTERVSPLVLSLDKQTKQDSALTENKQVIEALSLCKNIIQTIDVHRDGSLLKGSDLDILKRQLKYIEDSLNGVTEKHDSQIRDLNKQTQHIWKENQNPLKMVLDIMEGKAVPENLGRLQAQLDQVKPKRELKPGV